MSHKIESREAAAFQANRAFRFGDQLTANGFSLLNIELRHAAKVEKLPFYHRDPFGRLLIAQAMTEKMTLLTVDKAFTEYGVKVLW